MKDGVQQIIEEFEATVAAHDDLTDKMRAAIETHIVHYAHRRFLAYTSSVEIRSLTSDYRKEILGLRDQYESMWLDLLDQGIVAGVFPECDRRVAVYNILSIGAGVARWFQPSGRLSPEQVGSETADLIMNGLLTR